MNMFDLDLCRRCGRDYIGHQEDYCEDCVEAIQAASRIQARRGQNDRDAVTAALEAAKDGGKSNG